ncbi:MAG: hypothetical protein BWY89_01610 [Bacteroidetes bacterium ADurb.BinA012]|nr:MAG: hypothetical protein BWY89_01610 [Bacteroidetes bacterium ADurb.BinA012]
MSTLIRLSAESKRNFASTFASCVFPTPVGPRKINVPIGLFGSFSPALLRWIDLTILAMASSCPTMLVFNSSAI